MSDRALRRLALLVALLPGPVAAASAAATAVPDPTRPAVGIPAPAANDPASGPLVLQSTLVSPRQRVAIINGQRLRPGDRIGDARLEAVGPGWVRLSTPSGRTELRLSFSRPNPPVNR